MFSTQPAGLSQQKPSLLFQIHVLSLSRMQIHFAQQILSLYNITMCSFLYKDMVMCGEGVFAPRKTSHRWLCSSLVCKNETELFFAKQNKSIQRCTTICFQFLPRMRNFGLQFPQYNQGAPRPAALMAADDWSSAAAAAPYGLLGDDGRWTMGTRLFTWGASVLALPLSGDLEDTYKAH